MKLRIDTGEDFAVSVGWIQIVKASNCWFSNPIAFLFPVVAFCSVDWAENRALSKKATEFNQWLFLMLCYCLVVSRPGWRPCGFPILRGCAPWGSYIVSPPAGRRISIHIRHRTSIDIPIGLVWSHRSPCIWSGGFPPPKVPWLPDLIRCFVGNYNDVIIYPSWIIVRIGIGTCPIIRISVVIHIVVIPIPCWSSHHWPRAWTWGKSKNAN